jgi:hypothetical protein
MSVILAAYCQGMVRYSDRFLIKCLGRWHPIVHLFLIINAFSGCLKNILISIYPKAIDLSTDHRPNLPGESQRINIAGERVIKDAVVFKFCGEAGVPLGRYRINGMLHMSRSIGIVLSDFFLVSSIVSISLCLAFCLLAFQVIFISSQMKNWMLHNRQWHVFLTFAL